MSTGVAPVGVWRRSKDKKPRLVLYSEVDDRGADQNLKKRRAFGHVQRLGRTLLPPQAGFSAKTLCNRRAMDRFSPRVELTRYKKRRFALVTLDEATNSDFQVKEQAAKFLTAKETEVAWSRVLALPTKAFTAFACSGSKC